MGDDIINVSISLPTDEEGMVGRVCPECEGYFKLKPGTGLPTQECHCPYCEHAGTSQDFTTEEQIEYAKSIALNKVFQERIQPSLDKLFDSFKRLESSTRGGFIQLKVTVSGQKISLPVSHYSEKELETNIICNNCALEFSIYGLFARCPDCNAINAFLIFEKSIKVTRKHLEMFTKPDVETDLREKSLSFVLSSCISAFDGLGKELRKRKPALYPETPKNLFQNLNALNEGLNNLILNKHSNYDLLLEMFQVRHLYEHNMGIIDEDFIKKLPKYSEMLKRKYILKETVLYEFISLMNELEEIIKVHFNSP